ncbi:MAG: alkane 1-monooxygenase [Gammaproteobacteria bacterium]
MCDSLKYLTSLLFIALAAGGISLGGSWAWTGVMVFVLLALVDHFLPMDLSSRNIRYPWLARLLPYLHYPALFGFWMLFATQLASGAVSGWNILGGILSVGIINGLVGLATAHELMHGNNRFARTGADLIGTCYGVPITDLGHVHVHHIHLDTPMDGDTPIRGESIYRFAIRSVRAIIAETFRLEFEYLRKTGKSPWSPLGRLFWGVAFELLFAVIFVTLAGPIGLPVLIVTWVVGFTVMAHYNYAQHYGLVRVPDQPIQARHAWNHLKPLSRLLGYEITTHSEHHLDPDVTYTRLTPLPDAPQMPSILICFITSLIPPLWERLIARPRLRHWDEHFASDQEKQLAAEANLHAGWVS